MPSRSLTIEQVLTLLAETPPRIAALTAGLAPAHLHTTPNHDEWSANDVLAHLRACADVWGDCIVAMIAEDMPTLRAVNPTTWIEKTDYRELEFRPSLHAFATRRADLLAVLEPLPPEGWSRAATVTGAGKVLERTVLFDARWLAGHERQHVKQVERIVNTMPMEQRPPQAESGSRSSGIVAGIGEGVGAFLGRVEVEGTAHGVPRAMDDRAETALDSFARETFRRDVDPGEARSSTTQGGRVASIDQRRHDDARYGSGEGDE